MGGRGLAGLRDAAAISRIRADPLERAYLVIERHAPRFVVRGLESVRGPGKRWLRVPLGFFLILCSFFWFLPVVGLEFLPLGLLVLAEDVPALHKPVGRGMMWLFLRYLRFRRRWQGRRRVG